MKHYTVLLLLFAFSLLTSPLRAMGEWDIHSTTPYTTRLQSLGERLYTISGSSLCSYSVDSLDYEIQQLNRINGLSGSSVQFILTVPEAERMAIAYADGNLDILSPDGTIANIPDLANKAMAGDKSLLSLNYSGKDLFICGGFGIIIVDAEQEMITQSYLTPYAIQFSFAWGDRLYRYSSTQGLESGLLSKNLSDNVNWNVVNQNQFTKALCFKIGEEERCWLLGANGHLYQLNEEHLISEISSNVYKDFFLVENRIFLTTDYNTLYVADPLTLDFTPNTDNPFYRGTEFTPSHESGKFYMLLNQKTIFRMTNGKYLPSEHIDFICDFENTLEPEGIGTFYLGEMQLIPNGLVGISRRSYISGYNQANSLTGVLTTIDFETDYISNVTMLDVVGNLSYNQNFQGLTGLAIDPLHEQRYAISTGLHGVYIIDHDTLLCRYDDLNTQGGIEAFSDSYQSTRTSSVAYDEEGNLFVANSMQDTILRCLTTDGYWIKYPNPGMAQVADARRILISRHDPYGFKWVLNDYGYQKSKVGIYYDQGKPSMVSSSAYQTAWFSTLVDQDGNEYIPYYIYDLVEDLNGKIWVLTNLGPFVIEDTKATFEFAQKNPGKGKVRRVKIPRNDGTNLADYLMQSTICSAMVVDNFNRKWIGTSGAGLYLLSEDCITEIEHFSTGNSPLLSDNILNLCYNPESGILYISCEGGVLTYQTDAIEGEDDFSSLHCYPNPVRPEYSGELRIMGLMNDSQVSITAANGDLIFQTQSQGATATWDLRMPSGARVKPGIYLIHGVDEEGKNGKICKVLVL